mmetsp:Transcript_149750/g.480893  ORF Transcript_149750/g.480893 Transcript_149750/m.480893 type:complete len:112 (-) Transcript_149750:272-607(-)
MCGYNKHFNFGTCLAMTSTMGMNCSVPAHVNEAAGAEVTCKVYDAVLSVVGGPRLRCFSLPALGVAMKCAWGNETPAALGRRPMERVAAKSMQGHFFEAEEPADGASEIVV